MDLDALLRHIAAMLDGNYDDGLDAFVSAKVDGGSLVVNVEDPETGDVTTFVLRQAAA